MIETRRLKNVVIFVQTILSFVLSRKIKIRVIFNNREFLTFAFVNENLKLIHFLIIDHFSNLEKIEMKWKLGNIQFSKIENWRNLFNR